MVVDKRLIHDLLKLNPESISKIAEEIGYHRVNLQAGLAGKRPLPEPIINALLNVLGITNYIPSSNLVHVWKVGLNKSPLKLAIQFFFPAGAEIGAVWREENISLKKATDPLVQFIRHRNTRVIIVYKPLIEGISPKDFPSLHWSNSSNENSKMISVGERMNAWIDGDITTQEFDHTLGKQVASWDEVIKTSADKGLRPDDILDYIERNFGNIK
jgi:hypothetical protein